jgi:transposase
VYGANWNAVTYLSPAFGKWNSVWKRLRRWPRAGVWKPFSLHGQNPDFESIIIDRTIIRAHQHSSRTKGIQEQAIGRSRGGLSTKIHIAVG